MTQYLLSVHTDWDDVDGRPADEMQRAVEQVSRFNDDLQASGAWVYANGLMPPSTATVVDNTSGTAVTTDGPYLETKEHLGGFWIIDVPDLDVALEWANKASAACIGKVEVRPFQDVPGA